MAYMLAGCVQSGTDRKYEAVAWTGERTVSPMHGTANLDAPADGRARDVYPVPEVAERLAGVSERFVWSLIASGDLESIKVGHRRVVPAESLRAYIEKLRDDERQVRAAAAAEVTQ